MITRLIIFISIILIFSCKPATEVSINTPDIYNFSADSSAILNILSTQSKAWNKADIDKFMEGYWNSEDLTFIGGRGVTYGWNNTLNNYKKGYPNPEAMGQLNFEIIRIKSLGRAAAQVIGKFTLTRKDDKPTGYFTLNFQKIEGDWLITSDMTASTPNEQ
jgi:hypothetical protein